MNITLLFIEMIDNNKDYASAAFSGFEPRIYATMFLITGGAYLSVNRRHEILKIMEKQTTD